VCALRIVVQLVARSVRCSPDMGVVPFESGVLETVANRETVKRRTRAFHVERSYSSESSRSVAVKGRLDDSIPVGTFRLRHRFRDGWEAKRFPAVEDRGSCE